MIVPELMPDYYDYYFQKLLCYETYTELSENSTYQCHLKINATLIYNALFIPVDARFCYLIATPRTTFMKFLSQACPCLMSLEIRISSYSTELNIIGKRYCFHLNELVTTFIFTSSLKLLMTTLKVVGQGQRSYQRLDFISRKYFVNITRNVLTLNIHIHR